MRPRRKARTLRTSANGQISSVIAPRGKWMALPGFLYGLRQTALVGTLAVRDGVDHGIRYAAQILLEWSPDLEARWVECESPVAWAVRATQALLNHYGHPTTGEYQVMSKSLSTAERSYRIAMPYHDAVSSIDAIEFILSAINSVFEMNNRRNEIIKKLDGLAKTLRSRAPDAPNTFGFMTAAWETDVPFRRVIGNVSQFGTGRYSRLLDSTFTERTPAIGSNIARNKVATARILRQAGLPAPDQIIVQTPDDAATAAERMGFPVVVKPIDKDGGHGVFAGLKDTASVDVAARAASKISKNIIVERHFEGLDFRITVYGDSVVKVEQRIAAGVVGDGKATIVELIHASQASPRFQKILREKGRAVISLDTEALSIMAEEGLRPESVLPPGRRLSIRRKNNVTAGGLQVHVDIDDLHPDNYRLAVRAAQLLKLDIAGIDLLIPDISSSWMQTGALICEVNAQPQIGTRTSPAIYAELLEQLVGKISRIPVHLLIYGDDDPNPAHLADIAAEYECNAFSSHAGIWINGERLVGQSPDTFLNAQTLLGDVRAEGAICALSLTDLLAKGLPCDRFTSIRVLADHTKLDGILYALSEHSEHPMHLN